MSITLHYGGSVKDIAIKAQNGQPIRLTKAFENSVYPGVFLTVTEASAKDNAYPNAKEQEVGVFGEVDVDDINAADWDFDFQHGKGAFALALIKMKDILNADEFAKDNHGRKFGNPDETSTYVWMREVHDEEEGLSFFFVYPDRHTQAAPGNGFFLNVEENIRGKNGESKGPGFTVNKPYKMPEENDYGVEQLIQAIAKTLREEHPETYNQALKEVMEEVSDYRHPYAEDMSFAYHGTEPLELAYADVQRTDNGPWETLES